jgi:outer membrane murein-binding lipoprotein Lpp
MNWMSMKASGGSGGGSGGTRGDGGGAARRNASGHSSGFDWAAWQAAAEAELVALGCSEEQVRKELARKRERTAARLAWLHERVAALLVAEQAAKAAWARLVGRVERLDLDDPAGPSLPPPPEQAAFDAILAELRAAADGRWPRHLHFEV